MIHWPSSHLTPLAREHLDRFARTSAAEALAGDEHTWTVENWTWVQGPPIHVRLRNEKLFELDFTMDEDGVWRVSEAPAETHLAPHEDGSDESRDHVDAEQIKDLEASVSPGA